MTDSQAGDLRSRMSQLRVAIVHEWLSATAGSEQTFQAMANVLPDAELYALSYNRDQSVDFGARRVHTSYLDRLTQHGGRAAVLPLMPSAMRLMSRNRDFDLVISSSHAFSRAFAARSSAIHLSYTYTPMRYIWFPEVERHRSKYRIPNCVLARFRAADRSYATGVHSFAAISQEVRDRIHQTYERDSTVVYPPCDTEFFSLPPVPGQRNGAVVVGRLVSYKRVDLAIRACAKAAVDLTVIGDGPERSNLQELAARIFPGRVNFVGKVSKPDLREAYRSAAVVLFPGSEDFGIVPVEAQGCGAPVIALATGGALETVLDRGSSLVATPEADLFADAIRRLLDDAPAEAECRAQAEKFSAGRFARAFECWVADSLEHASVGG